MYGYLVRRGELQSGKSVFFACNDLVGVVRVAGVLGCSGVLKSTAAQHLLARLDLFADVRKTRTA